MATPTIITVEHLRALEVQMADFIEGSNIPSDEFDPLLKARKLDRYQKIVDRINAVGKSGNLIKLHLSDALTGEPAEVYFTNISPEVSEIFFDKLFKNNYELTKIEEIQLGNIYN